MAKAEVDFCVRGIPPRGNKIPGHVFANITVQGDLSAFQVDVTGGHFGTLEWMNE